MFKTTGDLFDEKEWRELGNILWFKVIDDNKAARKLMRAWHSVINYLQRYQAEKKVAAVATATLEGVNKPVMHSLGVD